METRLYIAPRVTVTVPPPHDPTLPDGFTPKPEVSEQYAVFEHLLLHPQLSQGHGHRCQTLPFGKGKAARIVHLTADSKLHELVMADPRIKGGILYGHIAGDTVLENRAAYFAELKLEDQIRAEEISDLLKTEGVDVSDLVAQGTVFGVKNPDTVLRVPAGVLKYAEAAQMLEETGGKHMTKWADDLNEMAEFVAPGSNVADTFNRGDNATVGAASDAIHNWDEAEDPGNIDFSIDTNRLKIAASVSPAGGAHGSCLIAEHVSGDHGEDTDYEMQCDLVSLSVASFKSLDAALAGRIAAADDENGYYYHWRDIGGGDAGTEIEVISIKEDMWGAVLDSHDFSPTPQSLPKTVKFVLDGETLEGWFDGTKYLDTSDATYSSGRSGFAAKDNQHQIWTLYIENFTLTALGAPPAGAVLPLLKQTELGHSPFGGLIHA